MKPEIVHVITGLGNGGAEAVLYRLVKTDMEYRHHVVSLMDAGKYGPLMKVAGIDVTCLGMSKGWAAFSGLIQLWRLLRKRRPAVVQTWMYHADLIGGVIARLAGVRNVFWNIRHTTLEPGMSSRMTILIARLCAWLSSYVPKKILCCAEKARQVHAYLGYDDHKMVVIANGYDLGFFAPEMASRRSLRSEWGVLDDMPVLGMVGRFDPQKDHESLLLALGTLKQAGVSFRCVLVGRELDESNQVLRAWIQRYGLEQDILLLGQRIDITAVMNSLDIHILSSSYGEAFPNVLAEAMACGTPCITTNVGDAALIVGKIGWVVPPKDSQALAEAIRQAIDEKQQDRQAWLERKQACRARIVENYSIEKMVSSYHEAWTA